MVTDHYIHTLVPSLYFSSFLDITGQHVQIQLFTPLRGGGTCSKLGAQLFDRGQTLGVQNLPFIA